MMVYFFNNTLYFEKNDNWKGAEFDVIKSINFEKVFIDIIGFENNYEDNSIPIVKYLELKDFKKNRTRW